MKWFSLGAIFPNTRHSELHITLPELCRYSPDDKKDTMIYFLSTVDDLSVLSNVFLSRFSFGVLLFLRKGKELPVNRLQFEVASCKAAGGPGGGEEGRRGPGVGEGRRGKRARREGESAKPFPLPPYRLFFPPALLFVPSLTGKCVHRLMKELRPSRTLVYSVGP